LLPKDSSYKIHHRNLQRLPIEIYKFKNNLASEILSDIFEANSNMCNTRSDKTVSSRRVKSLYNGTQTIIHGTKNLGHCTPHYMILNVKLRNGYLTIVHAAYAKVMLMVLPLPLCCFCKCPELILK
jgi:hypothetical protein